MRYKQYLQEVRQDSASEPDIEEPKQILWQKIYDEKRKRYYWYDPETDFTTFDEPLENYVVDNALIGNLILFMKYFNYF